MGNYGYDVHRTCDHVDIVYRNFRYINKSKRTSFIETSDILIYQNEHIETVDTEIRRKFRYDGPRHYSAAIHPSSSSSPLALPRYQPSRTGKSPDAPSASPPLLGKRRPPRPGGIPSPAILAGARSMPSPCHEE